MYKKILICFLLVSIIFSFTTINSYAFDPLSNARSAYDEAAKNTQDAVNNLVKVTKDGVNSTIKAATDKLDDAKKVSTEKFNDLKKVVQDNGQEVIGGGLENIGNITNNNGLKSVGKVVKAIPKEEIPLLANQAVKLVTETIKPSDLNKDVLSLKLSIEPAKRFLVIIKDAVNIDVGSFNLETLQNNPASSSFVKLAGYVFLLLLVYEAIWLLFSGQKLNEFLFNFFMALIGMAKNFAIITILVTITNLFITSFTPVSFIGFLIGKVDNFIIISEANTGDWSQFLFNGLKNIPEDTVKNLNPVLGFFASLVTERGQFYWTAVISSWAYVVLAIVNWIPMIVVNLTLGLLILISPVISVIGINETGRQLQTKFWALLWDCLIAKVSFHLVLWFMFNTVITGDVNFLYLVKSIIAFMILPVIVLKIRTMFAFDYYPSTNGNVNQTIKNSVNNVVSTSVNSVQKVASISTGSTK